MNPFESAVRIKTNSQQKQKEALASLFDQDFYNPSLKTPVTQKARGISFLMNKTSKVRSSLGWGVPKHLLFKAGEKFTDSSFNYPVFARPCPTVPRHGFVDSVMCLNAAELNAVSEQTYNVENDAELLITKPIDASYNTIITGGVISFAAGNDGATAGKNVKYFYINGDPIAEAIDLDPSVLIEGELPFYEIVYGKDRETHLVQVRSGPGVPACKDYIPATVKVEKIIKADGDLLEWESLLKELDPKTTIIDHTNGSLASHYAIHAIVNKIPIFTSYLPNIGDIVEPTITNSDITDIDRKKFFESFCLGFASAPYLSNNLVGLGKRYNGQDNLMADILMLSLAALHNFSSISIHKDYELLGIVLGLFTRTTFSVSTGEARFAPKKIGNSKTELISYASKLPVYREPCYKYMFAKPHEQCISEIKTVYHVFNDLSWGGGYGGKKWASCTRSSIRLFNACINSNISEIVQLFNKVINEEHNGGKYLNKVIDVHQFDVAAHEPAKFTLLHLEKIVNILSTVWRYKDTSFENFDYSVFKPVDIEEPYKPSKTHGGKAVLKQPTSIKSSIPIASIADGGWITDIEVDGVSVNCLKKVAGSNVAYLGSLISIPHYWALPDGSIVISKKALSKMVEAKKASISPANITVQTEKPLSIGQKLALNESANYKISNAQSIDMSMFDDHYDQEFEYKGEAHELVKETYKNDANQMFSITVDNSILNSDVEKFIELFKSEIIKEKSLLYKYSAPIAPISPISLDTLKGFYMENPINPMYSKLMGNDNIHEKVSALEEKYNEILSSPDKKLDNESTDPADLLDALNDITKGE